MNKRIVALLSALFLVVAVVVAQTKVSGTVVYQSDGEPVIGANVLVEGTKTGVVTNIDGVFTLEVPKGKNIVISYIGMVTQTLKPKNGMTVQLVDDTGCLAFEGACHVGYSVKLDLVASDLDSCSCEEALVHLLHTCHDYVAKHLGVIY